MTHHQVAPHDFLDFVHDVDLTVLDADPLLVEAIPGLPGRKFIFTNGDAPYAMRVLDRLGLGQRFEAIYDIHACGYAPQTKNGTASWRESVCQSVELFVAASTYK